MLLSINVDLYCCTIMSKRHKHFTWNADVPCIKHHISEIWENFHWCYSIINDSLRNLRLLGKKYLFREVNILNTTIVTGLFPGYMPIRAATNNFFKQLMERLFFLFVD